MLNINYHRLKKQLAALERLNDNGAGGIMPLPTNDYKLLLGLERMLSRLMVHITNLEEILERLVSVGSSCMYCKEFNPDCGVGRLHSRDCPIVLARIALMASSTPKKKDLRKV